MEDFYIECNSKEESELCEQWAETKGLSCKDSYIYTELWCYFIVKDNSFIKNGRNTCNLPQKSLEDIGIVHRPFQISILQNNKEYLNITIEPINSFFEVYDYSEIYVNKIILKEANKKQKILSIHDFNNLKINIECPTEIQYRIFGFDFSDRAGYPNPKKNCFLMMD